MIIDSEKHYPNYFNIDQKYLFSCTITEDELFRSFGIEDMQHSKLDCYINLISGVISLVNHDRHSSWTVQKYHNILANQFPDYVKAKLRKYELLK